VALTHASYYAVQMKTIVQDKGLLHTSCVYRDKNANKFYFPDRSYVRQFMCRTIPVTLQVKATPTTIPTAVTLLKYSCGQ